MKATMIACSSLVSLKRAGRVTIRCERGQLWLSVPGEDVILRAGESWKAAHAGTVLIEGVNDARFSLVTPSSGWFNSWQSPFKSQAVRSSLRMKIG